MPNGARVPKLPKLPNLKEGLANLIRENLGKTEEEQKKRVVNFLKGWEKTANEMKATAERAVPEFIPRPEAKPKEPGEPGPIKVPKANILQKAGFIAAAGPTVAARSLVETVPAEPSSLAAMAALGLIGRGLGTAAGKFAPKLTQKAIALGKTPIKLGFKKLAKQAPKMTVNLLKGIKPISKPVTETGKALLARQFKAGIPKGELIQPQLATQQIKNLASAAAKSTKKEAKDILTDQSKRIFQRITEAFQAGQIDVPKNLPKILKQNNMTPDEFANMFVDTISTSGRNLGILSQQAKKLGKFLPKSAQTIMTKAQIKVDGFDKLKDLYRAIDTPRRGLMVTQWATAMRNALSQAGRWGLGLVDDTMAGTIKFASGKPAKVAYRDALEDVFSVFRRFSPSYRKQIETVLNNDILTKTNLLSNVMGDVTLGNKAIKLLNTPNILQEHFFRKIALDARLSTLLANEGKSIMSATKDDFARFLPQAAQHALEMTFAKKPTSSIGNSLMSVYREVPFLTALANPYPRFYANAVKFLVDHSPFGYARLFKPSFVKQLASKNPDVAYQALARATTGTMLWTAGFAMRNSKFAGEKWYEIKKLDEKGNDTGKRIDTRAMAPFSTYLFIAEALKAMAGEKTNLNASDWLQGAVSINRIAGTGLVMVDWLRSDNPYKTINNMKEFLGQYLGGFTVPARTWADIIGAKNVEERIARNTRLSPLLGPAISNIPGLLRQLPKARSPLRAKPFEREQTLLRQMTGITIKTKNKLEQELHRLGMSTSTFYPQTGDKRLDFEAVKKMGPLVEEIVFPIVESKEYKGLEDIDKEELLKSTVGKIKTSGIKIAKSQNPRKAIIHEIRRRKPNEQIRIFTKWLKEGRYTRKELIEAGVNLSKLGIK